MHGRAVPRGRELVAQAGGCLGDDIGGELVAPVVGVVSIIVVIVVDVDVNLIGIEGSTCGLRCQGDGAVRSNDGVGDGYFETNQGNQSLDHDVEGLLGGAVGQFI